MAEVHEAQYSIHPGATKMYRDLREIYWSSGIKKDLATFVAKCATCQQVKFEHQRPGGMMKEFSITTWKWEEVNMDFVIDLSPSRCHHTSYTAEDYARLYI